ncbi:hypothetical protein BABA_22688 [Neobacillus bataviensis LMG 21833]|uniref:Uncharacterized protein n=1 Tax=Neobacillus bataviensis LMG 21833 TaxID=1117379 RepID=K6D8U4_9BACI|nr:hypothetical protein [Neobacillus bataviensis]EKN64744.1 hypothetical protein BABA_22688 [Neobacillus bataviensis LMG 21833]
MKRLTASVLFALMMLGVGTTYAFSDAGTAISTWFQHSFIERSSEIENAATNDMIASFTRLSIDIQNAAQMAGEQLMEFQLKMTADSEKTVDEHNEHYIQQLQATKENLKKQNEHAIQLYTEQAKAREAAQITKDAEAILAELLEEQN